MKQSDVVVTNEPWSLTRDYIKQLFDYQKQFLIIVNKNAITYKEVFPLLMNRQMWIGANKPQVFDTPNGKTKKVAGLARWFTNMSLNKSTDQTVLWKKFNQDDYPAYDNYAAFEVAKVADIPVDTEIEAEIDSDNLDGWKKTYGNDLVVLDDDGKVAKVKIERPVWGTPITVLDKYNPGSTVKEHNLAKMFDIVGADGSYCFKQFKSYGKKYKVVNGVHQKSNTGRLGSCIRMKAFGYKGTLFDVGYLVRSTYKRIFIRRKK